MGLNLADDGDTGQLFSHSREFQTGGGNVRPGQATIIVATDGSGDTDDIQEGINMLPSGGGVVYIKEGEYNIYESIIITADNVKLIGTGKATKLKAEIISVRLLDISSNEGVLIESLFFDGNSKSGTGIRMTSATSSSCVITKCWFYDLNTGISVRHCENMIITENKIDEISLSAIYTYTSARALIANNIISNAAFSIYCEDATTTIISNNQIFGSSETRGIYLTMISEATRDYNIIQGNLIDNCGDNIRLTAAVAKTLNRTIIASNVLVNGGKGINITHANVVRTVLHGNVIYNNTANITDNGTNTLQADNQTA